MEMLKSMNYQQRVVLQEMHSLAYGIPAMYGSKSFFFFLINQAFKTLFSIKKIKKPNQSQGFGPSFESQLSHLPTCSPKASF
jgi:hypothetical protein